MQVFLLKVITLLEKVLVADSQAQHIFKLKLEKKLIFNWESTANQLGQ